MFSYQYKATDHVKSLFRFIPKKRLQNRKTLKMGGTDQMHVYVLHLRFIMKLKVEIT